MYFSTPTRPSRSHTVLTLLSLTALGLAVPAVHAQTVVEPDNYADGTNISTAVSGITLSTINSGGTNSVFSTLVSPGEASTGTQVFSDSKGHPYFYFSSPTDGFLFRADFASPTNFVSLDFINNDVAIDTDFGRLEAFDASGNLVSDLTTGVLQKPGDFQTLTATSGSNNISYILAGGDYLTKDDVNLDHLVFGSAPVPEASTTVSLGLLLALGGLAVAAKRKKAVRSL